MNPSERIRPWWGILPIVALLALWEVAARLNLIPGQLFFPPFSDVMLEFYQLVASGVLVDNFLSSLVRVLIGLCAGSITGVTAGILMGWSRFLNRALNPIVSLLYPIPALGWAGCHCFCSGSASMRRCR